VRYDRYGDAYDTARAWVDGRGAPDEWHLDGLADDGTPDDPVDDGTIDMGGGEALEEGVLAGIVDDSHVHTAHFDAYHEASHYDSGLFDAQMMVMEAEHNANMMAISGIGGYHDSNYNGYIDTHDAGLSNVYHSMG
jgi:hypothetical protein